MELIVMSIATPWDPTWARLELVSRKKLASCSLQAAFLHFFLFI